MKYLFPCENCGETHTIDTSQAGQQISCQCDQQLEVPSLRGIRELKPASQSAPATPQRDWGLGRGFVFVAGLLLAVGCGMVAMFTLMYRARVQVPDTPVYDAETAEAEIDAWRPARLWDEWKNTKRMGLGQYHPPPQHIARLVLERTKLIIIVASILGVCGLGAAIGVTVFGGRKAGGR